LAVVYKIGILLLVSCCMYNSLSVSLISAS
jgi:hypothetical protein